MYSSEHRCTAVSTDVRKHTSFAIFFNNLTLGQINVINVSKCFFMKVFSFENALQTDRRGHFFKLCIQCFAEIGIFFEFFQLINWKILWFLHNFSRLPFKPSLWLGIQITSKEVLTFEFFSHFRMFHAKELFELHSRPEFTNVLQFWFFAPEFRLLATTASNKVLTEVLLLQVHPA